MTTQWLLLLQLLVVVVFSQSVGSQPTVDDQVCDRQFLYSSERKRDATLRKILNNQEKIFEMLNNQQQQLQTLTNRLGNCCNSSCTETRDSYGASCKAIRDSDSSSASGEYTIRTVTGRILEKVYCEMRLNGGGYTFLNPQDLRNLTNDEVQAMFTDKNSFLMRVRRGDNTQPYGVLTQLSQYQSVPLKLGLNEYSNYAAPQNLRFLGPHFLYYGFIPASQARSRTRQGLQVNGRAMTFTNCDSNPNSYIALFPNFARRSPSTYPYSRYRYQFCVNLFNSLTANSSVPVMPTEYFVFLETHWGGCGCYAQTDSRRTSVSGTLSAAVGFR